MDIISILLGIVKAIPIIDNWIGLFIQAYVARAVAEHKAEFTEALRILVENKDQSKLEEAIGSVTAGKPASDQTDVQTRHVK